MAVQCSSYLGCIPAGIDANSTPGSCQYLSSFERVEIVVLQGGLQLTKYTQELLTLPTVKVAQYVTATYWNLRIIHSVCPPPLLLGHCCLGRYWVQRFTECTSTIGGSPNPYLESVYPIGYYNCRRCITRTSVYFAAGKLCNYHTYIRDNRPTQSSDALARQHSLDCRVLGAEIFRVGC